MEKYERKFVVSCEIFSGYNSMIDITLIESIDDIITFFKKKLESVLKEHNLEALIEILKKTNFHIHSHTIEDILISDINDIFFICNHC